MDLQTYSYIFSTYELITLKSLLSIIKFPLLEIEFSKDQTEFLEILNQGRVSLVEKGYLFCKNNKWIIDNSINYLIHWLASPSSIIRGTNNSNPSQIEYIYFYQTERIKVKFQHPIYDISFYARNEQLADQFFKDLGILANDSEHCNNRNQQTNIKRFFYKDYAELIETESLTTTKLDKDNYKVVFGNNGQKIEKVYDESTKVRFFITSWLLRIINDENQQ
jgi:hypothetical protein